MLRLRKTKLNSHCGKAPAIPCSPMSVTQRNRQALLMAKISHNQILHSQT